MLNARTLLGFFFTLAFSLSGQNLLRQGVVKVLGGQRPGVTEFVSKYLLNIFLSPYVLAGIVLCGIGVIGWMFVLSTFEVSQALPILGGLAYLTQFFIDKFIRRADMSWMNLAGILCIVAGLYLVSQRPAPPLTGSALNVAEPRPPQ